MKCRVCGFEMDEGRTYCPMCGTKVYTETKKESAAADMAWNTKDFPKPKKLEDIEMNWGNMDSFMKRDASEGFVTVEKTQPQITVRTEPAAPKSSEFNWSAQPIGKADSFEIPTFMNQPRAPYQNSGLYSQPQQAPAYTQPIPAYTQPQPAPSFTQPQPTPAYIQPQPQTPQQPVRPAYQPYNDNRFEAWSMPAQKEVDSRYWYEQNFTASGTMKTGPAVPLAKERSETPVPPTPPVMPWQAKDVLQSAMPDATIKYVHVDQPRRVERPDYERAYPDYAAVPSQEQKRPEEFYTFTAKNEEFQKLLEQEYEKIKSINGNDYDSVPSEKMTDTFVPAESSVKAQDISAFERSLFGEPQPAYPESRKQEPKEEAALKVQEAPQQTGDAFADVFNEKNTTSLNLDELISDPLDPRFDIDTLEMTIKELKEEEVKEEVKRSERQQKLAAMEAAREAYFKSLDEGFDDEEDVKQKRFGKKKEEAKPAVKQETKPESVSDATRIDLDAPEKTSELKPEFVGLYDFEKDDEDEEEEPRSRHGFLKFLGIIVIIAAVLELVVVGFKYFMPDAEITAKAVETETMVVLAIKNFCINAWDKIVEVINKFKTL